MAAGKKNFLIGWCGAWDWWIFLPGVFYLSETGAVSSLLCCKRNKSGPINVSTGAWESILGDEGCISSRHAPILQLPVRARRRSTGGYLCSLNIGGVAHIDGDCKWWHGYRHPGFKSLLKHEGDGCFLNPLCITSRRFNARAYRRQGT